MTVLSLKFDNVFWVNHLYGYFLGLLKFCIIFGPKNMEKSKNTGKDILRACAYGGEPARLPGWPGRRDSFHLVFIWRNSSPLAEIEI